MKSQVIIPAAGEGVRFKSRLPKLLVPLCGKPLIVYSLEVFERSSLIDSIIVVAHKRFLPRMANIIRRYKLKKVKKIIAGGATRRESVAHGLKVLDSDTDFVFIHDGARPFVTGDIIRRALAVTRKKDAAIVAVPLKPTIKMVNPQTMVVQKTLRRDKLWEIQTPQVFKKEIILKAHEKIKDADPTDDALLVEKLGVGVKITMGDYKNIKITTKDDLIFAEAILRSRKIS